MILSMSQAADRRRRFVRPATKILAVLGTGEHERPATSLPTEAWNELHELSRRRSDMHARRWHAAAEQVQRRMKVPLENLIFALRGVLAEVSEPCQEEIRPTLRSLLDDLVALESEFDEVDFDLQQQRLWVVTDPIELEGVPLGRFKIRLDWSRLGNTSPYVVKALDPNPAGSDSSITHPHVNDRVLCEGQGRLAIRAALKEGRLFDFFVLVPQVLETYSESSAYVALARWQGITCVDCGCISDSLDAGYCEWCESDVCSECVCSCSACGRSCCSDCRANCHGCDNYYCRACLTDCKTCHEPCCSECLNKGYCETCRENLEEPDETIQPETAETAPLETADAQILAARVGEIAVPA